jgi:hypothetical protein
MQALALVGFSLSDQGIFLALLGRASDDGIAHGWVSLDLRMSALPPKADMCDAARDVRFGPIADMRPLFDHLVGGKQKFRGNGQAKRLGRL